MFEFDRIVPHSQDINLVVVCEVAIPSCCRNTDPLLIGPEVVTGPVQHRHFSIVFMDLTKLLLYGSQFICLIIVLKIRVNFYALKELVRPVLSCVIKSKLPLNIKTELIIYIGLPKSI